MWFVIVALLLLGFTAARFAGRRGQQREVHFLDTPLLLWTKDDVFTIRHVLNSVIVLGRTGSGKSSSIGKTMSRALLGNPKIALLILAAKPEDKPEWVELHKRAGRQLIVIEPGGKSRFNFLQYEAEHGADTRSLTDAIKVIGESISKGNSRSGGESGFFEKEEDRAIYHAITAIKLATGKVAAPELEEFIGDAADDPGQLSSERWQAGFHNQCLLAAYNKKKTGMEAREEDRARKFFLREWPTMADKTRSNIKAGIMGILHVFNSGTVHQLLSTETTSSPDDMLKRGVSILVNAPPSEFGVEGRFINAVFKYATQRAVLRRRAQPGDFVNVIWCDEFQQSVNSHDDSYLAQCRSHWGGMICLTQSMHSIFSQMKEATGKHQAAGMLGNFSLKAFLALGDAESAEFASAQLGRSIQTYIGGSSPGNEDPFSEMFGHSRFTGNFSEHMEKVLESNVFMNGLRTGGPHNQFLCDAILVQSGEPFANGANWIKVAFSQR